MHRHWIAVLFMLSSSAALFAQEASKWGPGQNEALPSWVFYWQLGISTAVGGYLLVAIKILWAKAESAEKARHEDAERFRVEDRAQLKLAMTTFQEVISALKENTRSIRQLSGEEE